MMVSLKNTPLMLSLKPHTLKWMPLVTICTLWTRSLTIARMTLQSLLKKYIEYAGRQCKRETTCGWELCVQWKDGATTWMNLKDIKEAEPIRAAKYAERNQLMSEPAFAWWVPFPDLTLFILHLLWIHTLLNKPAIPGGMSFFIPQTALLWGS